MNSMENPVQIHGNLSEIQEIRRKSIRNLSNIVTKSTNNGTKINENESLERFRAKWRRSRLQDVPLVTAGEHEVVFVAEKHFRNVR